MSVCVCVCVCVVCVCALPLTLIPHILPLLTELQALAETIGPYGIRFLGEKLMEQVSGQV